MGDVIDVIIPAKGTHETIGDVVSAFKNHPAIGKVIVVSNPPDLRIMQALVKFSGVYVLYSSAIGKGQAISRGLQVVTTPHVILCDSDVTGLSYDHISLMILDAIIDKDSLLIGVPDIPENLPERRLWAFPWVSGERCIPTRLIRPLRLHGYLTETQINLAAHHAKFPVRFEPLYGLKSPYRMSDERLAAMAKDAEWGREHGIL